MRKNAESVILNDSNLKKKTLCSFLVLLHPSEGVWYRRVWCWELRFVNLPRTPSFALKTFCATHLNQKERKKEKDLNKPWQSGFLCRIHKSQLSTKSTELAVNKWLQNSINNELKPFCVSHQCLFCQNVWHFFSATLLALGLACASRLRNSAANRNPRHVRRTRRVCHGRRLSNQQAGHECNVIKQNAIMPMISVR